MPLTSAASLWSSRESATSATKPDEPCGCSRAEIRLGYNQASTRAQQVCGPLFSMGFSIVNEEQLLWSRRRVLGAGLMAGGLVAVRPAWADLKIEITGVGANQLPIAVRPFGGTETGEDVAAIICADLRRSGAFRLVDLPAPAAEEPVEKPVQNILAAAKAGASVYVDGQVRTTGGRADVRLFMFDTTTGEPIDSVGYQSSNGLIRMAAHRCSDRIYTKLTGEGPMFASQIAYVAQLGRRQYELVVADSDGANAAAALRSAESIISPAWSPDGRRLAYVSFEQRKAIVYVHELASGVRMPVARYRGNNSAPAFSPDGQQLAVALSKDGLTQIYLTRADGTGLRRFTHSYGIDTEPVFSKDGEWIYFTSDRGGSPQIYRQRVTGSQAERVTFGSNYAISPDVSPDGRRLAYISRIENKFRTAILDLATGQDLLVTNTERDESPSFAPNGRFLVYATEENGRGILGACSADSRLTTRLRGQGNIREPAWGPVLS